MTRYICIECGAGGASSSGDRESPMSYHCHECGGRSTMWYEPHAKAYRELREVVMWLLPLAEACWMACPHCGGVGMHAEFERLNQARALLTTKKEQ